MQAVLAYLHTSPYTSLISRNTAIEKNKQEFVFSRVSTCAEDIEILFSVHKSLVYAWYSC